MHQPDTDLDDLDSAPVHWRSGAAPNPTHMVFLDRKGGGTTIAHLDRDGRLYGCREVGCGADGPEKYNNIIQAWMDTAVHQGLTIDDRRSKKTPPMAR